MPSPFPGMDPYFEHPEVFPDFHDRFVVHLSEHLQSELPAPYYASIGRRVWVEISQWTIGPDVEVRRARATATTPPPVEGGVATATRPTSRAVVVHVPHDERREPLLEIFTGVGRDRRLVTSIQLLSPTNKTRGDQGRGLYLREQTEVLESRAHLVEIDLLRGGEHTTCVPLERALEVAGPFDYHVCVRRFEDLEDYVVYPNLLRDPLPEVSIPLLPGDADVTVDLQAVFDRCYDAGPYRREIRYLEDQPVPPLTPKQAKWARALVEAASVGA